MAQNIERNAGRPNNFKLDRGGQPADMGPFIGEVVNNVDAARSGRLQVFIKSLATGNGDDPNAWRWVRYTSPFYGVTPKDSSTSGSGSYPGNQQSYGMWFTPPDIGTQVLCFFVDGDPNQGYYLGCVIQNSLTHMLPAIGAVTAENYVTQNQSQAAYFSNAAQLPVAEINTENQADNSSTRFFDSKKPVHSVQAAVFFQQGLETDTERGPIRSSAQRESPSTVYGVSTPGRPVYNGGLTPDTIRQQLASGQITPEQVRVIGRQGGHTLVMDDGDLDGNNQLFRLRTAGGHQIMMNDSDNFFHIIHANGQAWIEFGAEGTIDVYSTNSVNVRTQGDVNIHADRDINMFAGRNINMKSKAATNIGAVTDINLAAQQSMTIYSEDAIGVRADGTLALKAANGSFDGGNGLRFKASRIDLNGGGASDVKVPKLYPKTLLDDVNFNYSSGWQVEAGALESIVSRAPTHEPYPYHGSGVDVQVNLEKGTPGPPPDAEPVPSGVTIVAK